MTGLGHDCHLQGKRDGFDKIAFLSDQLQYLKKLTEFKIEDGKAGRLR